MRHCSFPLAGIGLAVLSLFPVSSPVARAADLSVVQRWMATNRGVQSVRIDFTQIRRMRSLKIPVRQDGTLWLHYPTDRFRWQTGDPPQTIVVRRGPRLFILRPQMKKFEIRPFESSGGGARSLGALAGGFPRDMDEFQRRYRVLRIVRDQAVFHVVTKPLGSVGRGVSSFTYVVGADDFRLRGLEIVLEDGSAVETVFNRVQPNIPIPDPLFAPPLDGFRETKFGS